MKAVACERFGPPEVLHTSEVAEPNPAPDEVKVRVRATSVNHMDVALRRGRLQGRLSGGVVRPVQPILGSDLAGEVTAIGEWVTDIHPGDRVAGVTAAAGGSYAEFACVAASRAVTLPTSIPYADAAAFGCSGMCALTFLTRLGVTDGGRSVLIVGASGGVGTFAVQLAAHYGNKVAGTCPPGDTALVKALGAKEVIDTPDDDPFPARDRYDVVLDTAGRGRFGRYRRALREGGVYSNISVSPRTVAAVAFNPLHRAVKRAHTMAPLPASPPPLTILRDLFLEGSLRSVIDTEFPLERAAAAHRHFETGNPRGTIVLTV